ncbi:MAG: T9SS type A sorting domain-containing protein [Ignavibacteria bacterium]|nr:T9SS type A sorting domain-containing protein [Ignavibacteria bacterium]
MKKTVLIIALFFAANLNAQWSTYTLPYTGIAYTLGFYNMNIGISLGHAATSFSERIYYTTNSGFNWTLASCPPEIRVMLGIQFLNSALVYACGSENVNPWKLNKLNNDFLSLPNYIRQKYLMEGRREFYSEYKSAFLKSTNAGVSWQKIGTFDTLTGYINDIHFFDANTGYALIDDNPSQNTKFYKTTNGGVNLLMINNIEPVYEKREMVFFDINTGFVCGENLNNPSGRIYKTTNGGLNWTTKMFNEGIDCFNFLNSTTGIAIGFRGTGLQSIIYKTTNAGNNWDSISYVSERIFYKIKSISSTGIAFAAGYRIDIPDNKITTMKTTNYGANWIVNDFNQLGGIYGISLNDQNNFFMSGTEFTNLYPFILKSTNGGSVFVNQIGTENPSSFTLHQNYPNPFNPSTKISFDIPKNGIIKLSVFNSLGQEVHVLLNEYMNPGSYSTNWNASGFPSGVYFYKLESGSLIQTKKMLLIK